MQLREQKKATVTALRSAADQALSLVIADPRGVTASDMDDLRSQARQANIRLCLVKNRLAKMAFADTTYKGICDSMQGMSLCAFSMTEYNAAAKLFKQFGSTHQTFRVTTVSFEGQVLDGKRLDELVNLPSRTEAIAMLLRTMNAPIVKLVGTFNAIPTKMVRVLKAIGEKK